MVRLLCRLLRAERHELPALAWAFAYFCLVLAAYYLLRPVRDSLAVEIGAQALRWLFTATFVAMLLAVPLFGWLCARLPRARLLPVVYAFFSLNLLAFAAALEARVFFVWLSVFNLFAVSVFWSFMSDLFDTAQAARLYGAIAAGGSTGAIAGPLAAASLVPAIGLRGLLVLSAALLAATVPCIVMLGRWARRHPRRGEAPPEAPIGGGILDGARAALVSPFLAAICGYLLCYTALSTALYFQQVEILARELPDAAARTQLLATVDLTVNTLTLALQVLAFSRLAPLLGPTGMLVVMPLVSLAGFALLGAQPALAVLIGFGIVRRVGEFAIAKPAREALYTVVPRAERYKAKNFIDTVVYRGGDALSGWLFAGLAGAAFVAAGISVLWAALGAYLGRRIGRWTNGEAGAAAGAASSSASAQPRS
ncbi:MAG TPA: MFS transporter [Burkholderiales bacterium]